MNWLKQRPLARVCVALGGAWMMGACILGGTENPPTLAGYFGKRLDGLTREEQLDSSLKALEVMKEKTGGAYRYRSRFHSWTGYWEETWIWVEGGAVVRREYTSSYPDGPGKVRPGPAWTERGVEIGTHAHDGHPPVLLDSLYRSCREILAADTARVRMEFGLDRDYILSSCGFVPESCADDCYRGIRIDVRWD